jgi:lipopolysaccharide transport system permease protein
VYKQTILGPLWFVLKPLLTTIVFTIVSGRVAKISTEGVPDMLFYMAGTVIWGYFANCMTMTSNTFIQNAGIFGKVYFPRLTIPISVVISNLLGFALQFGVFLGFLGFFLIKDAPIRPTAWIACMPVLLVQMAALGLGTGIIVSSLTTKYRDLSFLTQFGVQLWMYATPIVYPLSIISDRWKWLVTLNPMAPVVETFRYAFLGVGGVSMQQFGISSLLTLGILLCGIMLFSRIEKSFIDTV